MPYRKRKPRSGMNRNKKRFASEKVAMLRMRDLFSFKYDIRQILEDTSMNEDAANAFIANLITKGSRGSIVEAKEYVKELAEKGIFVDNISERICTVLDRNRKYR